MFEKRTDLADESWQMLRACAQGDGAISGVTSTKRMRGVYAAQETAVTTEEGARAIKKPVGTYITLDLAPYWRHEGDYFSGAVRAVCRELRALLPHGGTALVVGLGNAAVTPDAVGPQAVRHIFVTRHLVRSMPRTFGRLAGVSAVASGVLGTTGVEALEWTRGLVQTVRPDRVVAIDALASSRFDRLCTTLQMSDTGIVPGSGVGNHRFALSRETLGVPVLSVGVPTVVEAATLCADLAGGEDALHGEGRDLFVTPRSIDAQVRELARVIGYGVSLALQPSLNFDQLCALMG